MSDLSEVTQHMRGCPGLSGPLPTFPPLHSGTVLSLPLLSNSFL